MKTISTVEITWSSSISYRGGSMVRVGKVCVLCSHLRFSTQLAKAVNTAGTFAYRYNFYNAGFAPIVTYDSNNTCGVAYINGGTDQSNPQLIMHMNATIPAGINLYTNLVVFLN